VSVKMWGDSERQKEEISLNLLFQTLGGNDTWRIEPPVEGVCDGRAVEFDAEANLCNLESLT